ncbi:glycerol-3-phosphate responsive antiterminator [Paenibacillus flagellatus]|uniref:Glycerol uptake operon antiterminator regulatory protein n=1 Tax=Paenibacillus flagellatus TaxID=2211139 RepID=A0A2V5K3L6_9BACL|nr:glycerol-3-phosphate responsive antiterminator [Paenibacillus flagellatus]PYI53828.1 glycerol-3-phosphate responsive antiterminator GlpP [Paenibacillus flagellatus]
MDKTAYSIDRMIASVTNERSLDSALASGVRRINLVSGGIDRLQTIVRRVRETDKRLFVHIEMVEGIGRDAAFIRYMAETFRPDGIITTKSGIVQAAKQAGLIAVQRVFAIDTVALDTALRTVAASRPDEVELMPGLLPRIVRHVKDRIDSPLIVGGLIRRREEAQEAFAMGADYVSVSDESLWHPSIE